MDKKEFYAKIEEDDKFIRELALKYVEYGGNMTAMDVEFGTRVGFIDDIMYEDQSIAEKFQEAVDVIVTNKINREAAIRKIAMIETLQDIVSDATPEEDGGPAIRDKVSAANLLVKITEKDKPKKSVEKGGLDDLLKMG